MGEITEVYAEQAKEDLGRLFGVPNRSRKYETSGVKNRVRHFVSRGPMELIVRLPELAPAGEGKGLPCVRFKRSQPFSKREEDIAEAYAKALHGLARMLADSPDFESYWRSMRLSLVERAIAGFLVGEGNATCAHCKAERSAAVIEVLNHLQDSAASTYEGQRMPRQFIVADKTEPCDDALCRSARGSGGEVVRGAKGGAPLSLASFINRDDHPWSPMLGTGGETAIRVTAEGMVDAVLPVRDNIAESGLVRPSGFPGQFESLAIATAKEGVPGFAVSALGHVVVLSGGELLFVYRRGMWVSIPENVKSQRWGAAKFSWSGGVDGAERASPVRETVLEAVLDSSFEGHGGLVAIVGKAKEDKFFSNINTGDNETPLFDPKHLWGGFAKKSGDETEHLDLRYRLVARGLRKDGGRPKPIKLSDLSRRQRLELLGMDGALIINRDGEILASGVIVTVEGGGSGGRTSAARALAEYGCAFKISQDGEVTLYGPPLASAKAVPGEDETNAPDGRMDSWLLNRFG